jgi:GNAT superfamily N-acetyltransferase
MVTTYSALSGQTVYDLISASYPEDVVQRGGLSYGEPTTPEFFQEFINEKHGGIITGLGEAGQPVGMIALGYYSEPLDFSNEEGYRRLGLCRHQIAPTFFLFWFAVHPDHQGQGVGGKLLDEAIRQCENYRARSLEGKMNLKARSITALVSKDQAPRSYRAFTNRGFKPVLRFEDDIFGTEYLLQRVLH